MTIQATLNDLRQTVEALKVLREVKSPRKNWTLYHRYKIPLPGPRPKYPWRNLAVGASFIVPCRDCWPDRQKIMNSLTSCIANMRRKTGMNFVQRTHSRGVEVWRVK